VTTVHHSDPTILEAELLDRIGAAKAGDPLAPLLVVVPTNRLADHVARRIARRLGSAIGIDVLTHRALATRILSTAGRTVRVADGALSDALLARVIDRAPRGRLRDFVRDRPVARPALAATLADLRDAGVDPSALPASEVRTLHEAWTRAWDELGEGSGLVDEAGLAAAATPLAASFAARYAAVLHHGAYELIGVHEDLVQELDRGCEGVWLRPAIAEGAFPDLAAKEVKLADAQGARAELAYAAGGVLDRIASGAVPAEQAVIVRSFGPYASAVEALLLDDGLRWHTSFASSLRRRPEIAGALARIAEGTDRPAARWSAHAEALAAIAGTIEGDAGARLGGILHGMRSLEDDLGDTREVGAAEAAAFLVARVDATTVPPEGHEGGGPRLLDAMQARGMTFDHVALAGMNAGIWPRVPREDPFLPDETRRRLRAETGRPVPVHLDNDGEERLLLAMTLGSARHSIDVSWRRADDHGRPVVPSLALREIRRAAADAGEPTRIPAHPFGRLERIVRDRRVIRAEDELVLVALTGDLGADAGPAVTRRRPELAAGVAWIAATDSFDPHELAYDGRVEAAREPRALSVSALETLARCPLQFFFEHRLRIEPEDVVASPYDASRLKLGLIVHDALKETYERLAAEGMFDGPGLPARIERARELLRQAWADQAERLTAARARPLAIVERVESEVWRRSLEAFVAEDLERLDKAGDKVIAVETKRRSEEGGPELPPLAARLDRIVEGPAGRTVGDYKIGRVDNKVAPRAMLKGNSLQVAVYSLLEEAPVDLLGVSPDHEERFARFPGFGTPALRDGIVETIRVVAALDEAGVFPMNPGRHCAWCAFRSACRRLHPPSLFRGDHADDARDFHDLDDKSTKNPMLALVRGARR
jgi:RecB family exonuclease